MIYRGEFTDIKNKYIFRVDFKIGQFNNPVREIKLSGNDPIVITNNTDSLFEPIKTQSATVKILSENYLFDLYNPGYDVPVTITQSYDNNGTTITNTVFKGYVTPNIYNQTWDYVDEIEIQCISDLAMLKYRDYETVETIEDENNKQIKSIYEVIKKCLSYTRYDMFRFVTYDGYSFDLGDGTSITSDSILKKIYVDEVNFFEDNEEGTPWKCYEVLEEIAKILCCSFTETCGYLSLIHYDNNLLIDRDIVDYILSDNDHDGKDDISSESFTCAAKLIGPDDYFSSNNNISLDETYRKIKVKANTYPYDEAFNEIMNADNWVVSSKYLTNGEFPKDDRYVPSWDWLDKDRDMHHGYFLYFESDKMTPHSYNNNHGILTQTPQQDYIPVLIDSIKAQRRGNYRVGCGLMKLAMYKTEDYSVTNKLDWKPQIVFYTGVNTYDVGNYSGPTAGDRRSATKKLQDDVNNYMEYNFGQWSSATNWLPKNPLLEIRSESQINVSTDSYLIISGKMCINDVEWEGSVKEEWAGSDAFKQPTAYKLYDQSVDYPDNRNWIGFPILQLQIRVGNKMLCSKPELSEGTRIGMKYKWLTKDKFEGEYWDENWSCYIEVPVGAEKFSFYKFYDITNTCDWRLGLDNASGFAIPMKAEDKLTGQMTIYVVGPVPELYYLYVPDITKLPTSGKTYTYHVIRNPNNIWNNGWSYPSSIIDRDTNYKVQISYSGTMPSTILVQDLKFEIKEVTYHTYSDTVLVEADNKKTDQEYENIINGASVVDAEDIECKINTQDLSKCRSFSSLMYKNTYNVGQQGREYDIYDYIQKMSVDGGNNLRIQENNIIQTYKDHYSTAKIIFETDIQVDKFPINNARTIQMYPMPEFFCTNDNIKDDNDNYINMFINGFEWNLKNSNYKLKLIEY